MASVKNIWDSDSDHYDEEPRTVPTGSVKNIWDSYSEHDEEEPFSFQSKTTTVAAVVAVGVGSGDVKKSASYSRFDDEDDDEAPSPDKPDQKSTNSDDDRDHTRSKNILLESIVKELREEISSLKAELASLKGMSAMDLMKEVQETTNNDVAEDDLSSSDRVNSMCETEIAFPIGAKGSRSHRAAPPLQNSSEWERLAKLEKERRQTKRCALHRRSKKATLSANDVANKEGEASNDDARLPKEQLSVHLPSNARVKRRDSFFDASSEDETQDKEEGKKTEEEEEEEEEEDEEEEEEEEDDDDDDDEEKDVGRGIECERVSFFAWDDDSGESEDEQERAAVTKAHTNELAVSDSNTLSCHANTIIGDEDRARTENHVVEWARGKDIISMIASIFLVYNGTLNYRLPPAWIWKGNDVTDRSSITISDIRKAYLRVVRVVHPDKQTNADNLVRLQAQAVFTALSDAYAAQLK